MTTIIYGITRLIGVLEKGFTHIARFFNKHYLNLPNKTLTAFILETQKTLSRKEKALDFNAEHSGYMIDKIIADHDTAVDKIHANCQKSLNKLKTRGDKIGKR